jgi:hypothetical protein
MRRKVALLYSQDKPYPPSVHQMAKLDASGSTLKLFNLENLLGNMRPHNIDLHAVNGPGGVVPDTIAFPGESTTLTFEALIRSDRKR